MALAVQTQVSDGSLTTIPVGIDFMEQADIQVYFDLGASPLTAGVDYSWTASKTITFSNAVPAGTTVFLLRQTQVEDMLNIFDGGAGFTRYTLDENFRQILLLAQEVREGVGLRGIFLPLDMHGYQIKNLGTGTLPTDAVNLQQVQALCAQVVSGYQAGDANLQQQISGGAPLEASAFSPISWHAQTIQNSVAIPANKNAWSFGPKVAIAPGQAVTVGEGSVWTIAEGDEQDGGLDMSAYVQKTALADAVGAGLVGYRGRNVYQKLGEVVSVKDFGAKGDMVSDDTTAFRDAISYCRQHGCILHITSPEWSNGKRGYLLSGQLYFDGPISVDCDPMAIMQWTSALGNNPAILIDYGDVSYNLGYFRFPILNGPSSDSLSLSGTAIKVANGDIIDCQVNYIHGWDVGYHGAAISSNSENNKFRWEVMDKVNTGMLLEAANGKYLDVSEYYGNTIGICKYGIRFKTSSGGVVADNRIEVQQVWSEILNGSCVYSEGEHNNQRNTVRVAYARAESTANTPASQGAFKSPLVSGDKQFLSQDGFWAGSSNRFEISPVPTGSVSGDPIRFKVNGYDNKISFPNSTLKFGATALSSAQGESNFLGGVGSALIFESTIVNQSMPAAAAGTVSTFYLYHQALTGSFRRRVQINPLNDYQGTFAVFAEDNSNNVNREIKITIRHLTATQASQMVSFHLTV